MGFLDGLTTLLGGFSDVKQIDKEGFDFREKRRAEQFARDQEREDWATKAAAEAGLGLDEDTALESTIPRDVDRARVMARARGTGLQAKSSLEGQKAYNASLLLGQRGAQALDLEGARAETRKELLQEAERIRADQTLSPREKDMLLQKHAYAVEMFDRAETGRNRRAAMSTGKPQLRPTAEGDYSWMYPPGGAAPVSTGVRVPLAAPAKEAEMAGTGALSSVAALKNLLEKSPGKIEEWFGPTAALKYQASSGQAPGMLGVLGEAVTNPPGSDQAMAYSLVANLKNAGVKAITGAQMSEQETPRLFQELPTERDRGPVFLAKLAVTEARFNILDRVRRGEMTKDDAIRQINSIGPEAYLAQYQQQGLGGSAKPSGSRYQKQRVE